MKKIGIIGSGVVAKTLGAGFLKHGYEVKLGTRSAEKLAEWRAGEGEGAQVDSPAEAAAFGEILVLAVKGTAAKAALELVGAEKLAGKSIMDATNPIAPAPPEHGVLKFFTNLDESLMEQLQAAFPWAHFVKAFSSVGSASMANPDFSDKPTMFICRNDQAAKDQVSRILDQFGWETADMGVVAAARAIEPLCMLWCIPGFLHNQWTHAFKLLRR